jgi:hypothetical protein
MIRQMAGADSTHVESAPAFAKDAFSSANRTHFAGKCSNSDLIRSRCRCAEKACPGLIGDQVMQEEIRMARPDSILTPGGASAIATTRGAFAPALIAT